MLDQNKRWVNYYKNFLKPSPEDAPYTKMSEILETLHERFLSGECVKLIENQTSAIRIRDMAFNKENQVATLLFQYSDTKISDPTFANLETGELRVEPKLDGEGVAVSAHMVLSLIPEHPRGATYLTLLEDVPGIGRTKIEPFLTSEFRAVFEEHYQNAEGRTLKYRPTSEISGYAKESLKEGLQKGVLTGLEFKKYKNVEVDFDEPGFVKVDSYTMKLKLKRKLEGDEALSLIDRVRRKAKASDYQDMVVRYERNEGKGKTFNMSTAREDAADALYSKFEIITVTDALPQCLPEIREEFATKMIKLLVQAR